MQLSLEKIGQIYDGLTVLDSISLQLHEGKRLALLGPSGCGKSTLLKILVGLDKPTSGRVLWQDADITGKTGILGYMGQEDQLLPWLKLWENVGLSLKIRRVPRHEIRERTLSLLKEFSLDTFADHYPYQLSGGMRQRAAFLRTHLANREILLLDEPFAALDALTRRSFQGWLDQFLRLEQSSLVLVTHSIEEALLLCDRVIVLSPLPARVVLDEPVRFFDQALGEKEFLPQFLDQKKRIWKALS